MPAFDFEADEPVCPQCGTNGKKRPLIVVERATIHYLVTTDDGPIRTPNGRRQVACIPAMQKLPKHATGERASVTCPKCRDSYVYRGHVAANVVQDQAIMKLPVLTGS